MRDGVSRPLLLLMMPPFPRLYGARGPGDLPTSCWWLEQVVVVDFLEWEG